MAFNRKEFFDSVRASLFAGGLSQDQVDGMNFKLDVWEAEPLSEDLRHLAYPLATSYHETGALMQPVREGFAKTDEQARAYVKKHGYAYASPDPVTNEVYYGRGDIQVTWADNYKRVGQELGLGDALYLDPERMLDARISADALFQGMMAGWYRKSSDGKPQTLGRYFSVSRNDAFTAREIVNGDKNNIPNWSHGVNIGSLIKGYHQKFLAALEASWIEPPTTMPAGHTVFVNIIAPEGVDIVLTVNGVLIED